MTNARRELIFQVLDDDQRLLTFAHMCTRFYRCDDMLEWLIRNRMTGRRLYDWLRHECLGSDFTAAKFVLTKVKREKEMQPVIAGKDFISNTRM